jgi:hypothetical protein
MPNVSELTAPEVLSSSREFPRARSLDELGAMVRRDLDLIQYPIRSWVLPKIAPDGTAAFDGGEKPS